MSLSVASMAVKEALTSSAKAASCSSATTARQSAAAVQTLRTMGLKSVPRMTGVSRKSAILSSNATNSPVPRASLAAAADDEEEGDIAAAVVVPMATGSPMGVSRAATAARVARMRSSRVKAYRRGEDTETRGARRQQTEHRF